MWNLIAVLNVFGSCIFFNGDSFSVELQCWLPCLGYVSAAFVNEISWKLCIFLKQMELKLSYYMSCSLSWNEFELLILPSDWVVLVLKDLLELQQFNGLLLEAKLHDVPSHLHAANAFKTLPWTVMVCHLGNMSVLTVDKWFYCSYLGLCRSCSLEVALTVRWRL